MTAELAHLISLAQLEEMGPSRMSAILRERTAVDAVELLRSASLPTLSTVFEHCPGVNESLVSKWSGRLQRVDPESVLRAHSEVGVEIADDSELRTIEPWCSDPEPPRLLFRQGAAIDRSRPSVGIVGTRRCTAYGRSVAGRLGADLAEAGVSVVSGVAAGIDGAAQRAAMQAGGHVVGVVAGGLDRPYPRVNEDLWHRLAATGTLLSEYPLGTDPTRWRFPARNRLIAALSDLVIVVESPEKGGSMVKQPYVFALGLARGRGAHGEPQQISQRQPVRVAVASADSLAVQVADIFAHREPIRQSFGQSVGVPNRRAYFLAVGIANCRAQREPERITDGRTQRKPKFFSVCGAV